MHAPEKFTNLFDSVAYEQSFSVSDNPEIVYDTTADTLSTDLIQRGTFSLSSVQRMNHLHEIQLPT